MLVDGEIRRRVVGAPEMALERHMTMHCSSCCFRRNPSSPTLVWLVMQCFAFGRFYSLFALSALAVSACDQRSSASVGPSGPGSASAAPAAASTRSGPRAKETTPVDASKLGTLPEGVGLAVGAKAPSSTLNDAAGSPTELAKHWQKGRVLLVFYRGGWCPYCNFQVRSLTQAYPELQKRGVTPVLVSVDRPSEGAKTRATYEIPFPVLSDPELGAHEAFRVLQQVDDATLKKYKEYGIDLEASSGQTHHTIAVPAVFLIDQTGTIRWAHADRDYKVRPTPAQLLQAIDRLDAKK